MVGLLEGHGFEVVGQAKDGAEAVAMAERLRPDLVLMDVMMAGMDGLAATAEIMRRAPCPVVVVSSLVDSQQKLAFDALKAGAVDVMAKPRDLGTAATRTRYLEALTAMAQVKVIRRRADGGPGRGEQPRLVAIGASTGGPPALCSVLSHLGADFPAPILVAQHLATGFTTGLARWLGEVLALQVVVVHKDTRTERGFVYFAADGHHLESAGGVVRAVPASLDSRVVPSVNRLFTSCLGHDRGVVAVLLTGMGEDGAQGLLALRERGHHTIVQDEATSLVYGMPRVARELGAAEEELPLQMIGPRLSQLARGWESR